MANIEAQRVVPITDSYRRTITFLIVTVGVAMASIGIMDMGNSVSNPDKTPLSPAGIIGEFPHTDRGNKGTILLGAAITLSPLIFKGIPKSSNPGKINDYG